MGRQIKTKKGPKGKKARAKHKLERQWGEEGNFQHKPIRGTTEQSIRKVFKKKKRSRKKKHLDVDEEPEQAFTNLITEIQPTKIDSDDESEGPLKQDENDDDQSLSDASMDEEVEKGSDLYTERYSKKLPEDETQKAEALADIQETQKVIAEENPSMEFQFSSKWLQANQLAKATLKEWKQQAKQCFIFEKHILTEEEPLQNFVKSPVHARLYPAIAHYLDTLWVTPENPERTLALHTLHHVYTSRHRIQLNNQKSEPVRDQGFTRPTVLVLLPTRSICYDFCNLLFELLGQQEESEYMERFHAEFGPVQEEADNDLEEDVKRHRRKVLRQKGREWNELFGDGVNDDDDFKLGLSLQPGKKGNATTLKTYTDFFKSDIIVASPLGLKISIDNKEDYDFLSSIELSILMRSEVLLMQNWDHVNEVLAKVNQQPKESNDTDFSRVREHLLAGQSENWRQLIVCSKFLDPSIQNTFGRFAKSVSGLARIRRRTPLEEASISSVVLPIRQAFLRVESSSLAKQSEDRFKYFQDKVLPQILESKQKHTMIFTPSYFDFVTIRNYFMKRELSFVSVTEYSRTTEVGRGRARFLQGRRQIMLYTGRAHFFHRHAIKGIRHLIFFGVPEEPGFYPELVNLLNEGLEDDSDSSSSLVLFNKYDAHALERVVGTSNSKRMIKGEKTSFLFTS